jgi:hypothetical protein
LIFKVKLQVVLCLFFINFLFSKEEKNTEKKKNNIKTEKEAVQVKPLSEFEINEALKNITQRNNKQEIDLNLSFGFTKKNFEIPEVNSEKFSKTTFIEANYFYLLTKNLEPGGGIIFYRGGGMMIRSILLKVIWNFQDVFREKFIPYVGLGLGYSDLNINSNKVDDDSAYGYTLPDFRFGFKYFLRNNVALNIQYYMQYMAFKGTNNSKRFSIVDRAFLAGFSVFF